MDDINAQQLARCSGECIVFAAQDVGSSEALAACLVHTAVHPASTIGTHVILRNMVLNIMQERVPSMRLHSALDKARANEAQEKALHLPSGVKAQSH